MKYKQFENKFIIRIDKGEEIVESLKTFCRENKIDLGTVFGIGAANKIVLGLFETETKKYLSREFSGDFELTSVLGNISQMNGDVYLHLHANIADKNCQTFGGHLTSAVVSATFEAVVEKINGTVERKFSEEIGLNLFEM